MTGPTWIVPIEAVRGLANGNGTVILLRLRQRFCQFQPHASIELSPSGFVAEVTYDDPKYPGRLQTTAVPLTMPPQENMRAPA